MKYSNYYVVDLDYIKRYKSCHFPEKDYDPIYIQTVKGFLEFDNVTSCYTCEGKGKLVRFIDYDKQNPL